jgi:hypothetical protein
MYGGLGVVLHRPPCKYKIIPVKTYDADFLDLAGIEK